MHEGGVSHARSLRVLHSEICHSRFTMFASTQLGPASSQVASARLHPTKAATGSSLPTPRTQAALPDRLTAPEEVDHLFQAPTRHISPD
jgi:hypothetical protein